MLGEKLGGLLADVPDAESKNQPVKIVLLGFLNSGEQVRSGLFSHALDLRHVLGFKAVKVGRGLHEPICHELLEHRRA